MANSKFIGVQLGLLSRLLLIACGLFITGCGKNKNFPSGHFEGTLLQKLNPTNENPAARPVRIDFTFGNDSSERAKKTGAVRLTDQEGHVLSEYLVSVSSQKEFYLTIPELRLEKFHLKQVTSDSKNQFTTCFADRTDWEVEFCYDGIQFRLRVLNQNKVGVLKLFGSTFGKEQEFNLELPARFSVQEVVQRALSSNFDSKIGFEHLIQAKSAVTAAYLNLIPHLTTNLIWNADPGYISAIATLQGLAPFVLPTYWLQAKESEWDLKIKRDADLIVRADLAAMVEQLSYALYRDQSILQLQEETARQVEQLQAQIPDLEKAGQIGPEAAGTLALLLNQLQEDSEKIRHIVLTDRYTLSQALGFHNPEAVLEISVGAEAELGVAPLVRSEFAATVSRRSYELQQLDFLKEIAKLKKTELYFAWIDPTGDPKSGFGFNTIPQLKVADSQQRELELKREQLKISVYQNAYRIADEYNGTVDWFMKGRPEAANFSVALERMLSTYLSKSQINPDEFVKSVSDLISDEIGNQANLTSYRIAKSKVERVLLAGYYENVVPNDGKTRIDPGVPLK